jgi:1,4-dihydroxy-2-naphthoyl-CoA synthase
LNALSSALFKELNDALTKYDEDTEIGAIIITGSEKAFAGKSHHFSSRSPSKKWLLDVKTFV